jgi:hypothetical protein
MPLDTDLSLKPYFNDFQQNSNHYAVLFRPRVAVQARELNNLQGILQDQIDKFGRHIFKEGSVVEGCSFSFDSQYEYVKLRDNYANGTAFTIDDFKTRYVTNANGLRAQIVDVVAGFESTSPDLNTLYIKYLNSTTYSNGATQSVFAASEELEIKSEANVAIGNVTVANVANTTGEGYNMYVTEGVIFKKGYFIRVPPQGVIVTKYSNKPDDLSIGFGVIEEIETPESNTSLLDNAAGYPNVEAPGAHRLKLTPTLEVRSTSADANTSTFFSICDFKSGKPATIKNDPQYAALGNKLAKEKFETNGDFVVNPFILSTEAKVANTTHLSLISATGLGYAKGYRVEFLNKYDTDLRKGTDTETVDNQVVSTNFGYYVTADQFLGDFNLENVAQVELHSAAYDALDNNYTSTGFTPSASNKIGTAYIRGIELNSGVPGSPATTYDVYLFNIKMDRSFSFNNVKSIVNTTTKAVADVVLTYVATSNSYIAKLQEIVNNTLVYPFGQKAVTSNGFSNTSFVYRNRANSSFAANTTTNTVMTVTPPTTHGTGSETFIYSGTLSDSAAETFIVIPTANAYSSNNAGTINVFSTNTLVTGTSTTFTTTYAVGDSIRASGQIKQIASISNSTVLRVNSPFTSNATAQAHQLAFPHGKPIAFSGRDNRSISISGNTATFNLGSTANGVIQCVVYHDLKRSGTVATGKTISRNTLIKIDTSNNAGGTTGPWSLGLPDVFKLNSVYLTTNSTYSNGSTGTNIVRSFALDTGQRDSHYDLASLVSKNAKLPSGSKLLVSVDHFQYDESQGVGFFTANSYPIDDINGAANTAAITTQEIPVFTSTAKGTTFDLRDSVDFRPFASNTAAITTVVASATINPSSTLTFDVHATGSYLPSPNELFETNLQYYLPRIDRIGINTSGQIVINEGVPSLQPRTPPELPGTMTLGTVDVSPYPTLSPAQAKAAGRYDYSVTTKLMQTKRFTMADIGTLADRIENLEYYTSLSLLEQSAANLLVRSGTTGQNRFKNGILVDPFKGHDIGNTLHPKYLIAIDPDRKEARPYFKQLSRTIAPSNTTSNASVAYTNMVTINNVDIVYQRQPYASKYRNCVEGNVYQFRGSIKLYPPGDTEPDTSVSPDVVNNLDLASNWVNLSASKAWGTEWGSWITTGTTVKSDDAKKTGEKTTTQNPDGSKTVSYATQINTTTTTSQTRVGEKLTAEVSSSKINLGQFVTNVSISPYMKTNVVFFSAVGLKPNTRVYPFFNDTAVTGYCLQLNPYTTASNVVERDNRYYADDALLYSPKKNVYFKYKTDFGGSLVTDSSGAVAGLFQIPKNTFKAGNATFKLTDISDLDEGVSAVKSQATAVYIGSGLSVAYGKSILNTKEAEINIEEITENKKIKQSEVVTGPPVVVNTPAPTPPPVEPPPPVDKPVTEAAQPPAPTTYYLINIDNDYGSTITHNTMWTPEPSYAGWVATTATAISYDGGITLEEITETVPYSYTTMYN